MENKKRNLGRLAFPAYLLAATAFLALQTLQGLSYLDPGMYLAGYLNFNDDPWACQYLGQWYLTYKLTGALCSLLGAQSFIAIRLMAVVLNVAMQAVIYLYLRRYMPRRFIIAGLAMATLACFGSYTDINYNDYSVALLTLAIITYHAGAFERNSKWLVFASGAIVGVAFFFRVPNLTFVALPLLAVAVSERYYALVDVSDQLLFFFGGCIVGCAAVVIGAWADGSLGILEQTMLDLVGIGTNVNDPHSPKNLLIGLYTTWKEYVAGFAPIAVIAALMVLARLRLGGMLRKAAISALALAVIPCVYFWEPSGNMTAGLALAALAFVIINSVLWDELECLFVLSLLVPLVYPIGSNGGTMFFGQYIGFLSTPLALAIINRSLPTLGLGACRASRKVLPVAFAAVCVALLLTNAWRPMMEEGTRAECRYTIDSPVTGPIMTTRENADMYNMMIREVKPLLPKGSYLICNFSLPLISVLECKPYAVLSDVFTSNEMNYYYIAEALMHTGGVGRMPYMLLDRNTMTCKFSLVVQQLRLLRPYRTVWSNGRYELLEPGPDDFMRWHYEESSRSDCGIMPRF